MLKIEAWPDESLGVVEIGARAGGNRFLTLGGFFLLILSEKGDGVAERVNISLMGKTTEHPVLSRQYTVTYLA